MLATRNRPRRTTNTKAGASVFTASRSRDGGKPRAQRARGAIGQVAGLLERRSLPGVVCETKGAFYERFEPQRARALVRRIVICYTPKTEALNIAECELSAMTRQCLSGRVSATRDSLQRNRRLSTDVNRLNGAWIGKTNDDRRKEIHLS